MSGIVVPAVIAIILVYGVAKGVNVYSAMVEGVTAGIRVVAGIFPAILVMLTAIAMIRASGAIDIISHGLSRVLTPLGIPEPCIPLALLRPFSGGGALSLGSEIIGRVGADTTAGRVAAVMLGSSETSFYTIAVYSAYLKMKNTRYAVPAALSADLAAFLASAWAVRLMMR